MRHYLFKSPTGLIVLVVWAVSCHPRNAMEKAKPPSIQNAMWKVKYFFPHIGRSEPEKSDIKMWEWNMAIKEEIIVLPLMSELLIISKIIN